MNRCPICGDVCSTTEIPGVMGNEIACARCGDYQISRTALLSMSSSDDITARQRANAAGWIREHQNIQLDTDDIRHIFAISTPTVAERAQKILVELNRISDSIDSKYTFLLASEKDIEESSITGLAKSSLIKRLIGISSSQDYYELFFLIQQYLIRLDLMTASHPGSTHFLDRIFITPSGYKLLDELKRGNPESSLGFCAMWFGPKVKMIWNNAIEPAIEFAGYEPKRIDEHEHNNRIDDEIIALIRACKFLVADFTGYRGGVYFEAGFALGLGRPVIWTCEEKELKLVHFDNRQYNFITWTDDKLDVFARKLQNRIEATIGKGTWRRKSH